MLSRNGLRPKEGGNLFKNTAGQGDQMSPQEAVRTTSRWHESWWTGESRIGKSKSVMKKQKEESIAQAGGAPIASETETKPDATAQARYQQIKLALDVHAGDLMELRMVDARLEFSQDAEDGPSVRSMTAVAHRHAAFAHWGQVPFEQVHSGVASASDGPMQAALKPIRDFRDWLFAHPEDGVPAVLQSLKSMETNSPLLGLLLHGPPHSETPRYGFRSLEVILGFLREALTDLQRVAKTKPVKSSVGRPNPFRVELGPESMRQYTSSATSAPRTASAMSIIP